ncbi:MAG: ATP-dependent protease ATPase subunit HslU [Acidobacteriota bacterium]
MNAPDISSTEESVLVEDLTPKQIVGELDKHVVGQGQAKRAVAIALRNRWRRQQLDADTAEEIVPKNILMIGPTGVGKTEIARRLAKLAKAPFLKVEASKFTEVGYVGRDVESMIRDLTELAVIMVREERSQRVREQAAEKAEERLLDLLLPKPTGTAPIGLTTESEGPSEPETSSTREKFRQKLRRGELDHRKVEITVEDGSSPSFEMFTPQGVEEVGVNLKDMMPGLFGKREQREVTIEEAREILVQQEAERLIDQRLVAEEARTRVEQAGIVFLDEIDKVCGREGAQGPDVSREGVQRDLLPIVEGTTVSTKHGMVKTDHILFIGAGAFHLSKPSDMIPELQGRFPIRVELDALTEPDLVRILTEPRSSLTRQYTDLMSTEGVRLVFEQDAIEELARLAVQVNSHQENIGARRLATLMERLLDEVSFEAPAMDGVEVKIDSGYVTRALDGIVQDQDLSKYVL